MTELTTGRASEGGHWYARDGSCVYQIPARNGALRDVTLRDARKLGLVPGFSSIAGMEYRPALEKWKIEQMALAALTLPRIEGETLEAFKARAYEDSQAQAAAARERGTALHAALQGFYEGTPVDAADAPYVWPVVDWLTKQFPGAVWLAETSFAHPAGYGGKCDLRSSHALVDFKFKDFDSVVDKHGKPKRFAYDEHEMQLHAYAYGFGMTGAAMLNLFVSSTVPGLIVPVVHEHNPAALDAFFCLLKLWQIRRKYDSRAPGVA